jgi:hypothetical protein
MLRQLQVSNASADLFPSGSDSPPRNFNGTYAKIKSMDFVDKYIMLAITVSVAMVLVSRLIVYIQDYILLESPSSGFTLESNLILLLYSGWKTYECLICGSYSGLFAAFIAMCIMNTAKIYVLFSYNILHVINIFSEQANQSLLESSQTTP